MFLFKCIQHIHVQSNKQLFRYSNELREQLLSDGIELSEIYKIVSALSCDYVRKNSLNSCWNEGLENIEIETCSDKMSVEELEETTLEDLLSKEGVKDNQCLQQLIYRTNLMK